MTAQELMAETERLMLKGCAVWEEDPESPMARRFIRAIDAILNRRTAIT